jgi:zona occludens toxin (predicted ATPase)
MSLNVIHGKPGSGKSCYCVSLLLKLFSDWVRYRVDKGEVFSRVLYTNIPLNIDNINSYLSSELMIDDVDITSNVVLIDDTFFLDDEWWEKFPQGAYIVIDEVHHWLPSGYSYKASEIDTQKKFMNYISTHRHRQHDLIFLTQHIDNVSVEIKKQAEQIFEVCNVKSMKLGFWPFTIPMADIDVVRESFGVPQQFAHIKRGVCEARRVVYDKVAENFVLTKRLFDLYRSHTLSNESLDRPSLNLSRIGSLFWLFRRHFIRLSFWLVVSIGVILSFFSFFRNAPQIMVAAMTSSIASSKESNNRSETLDSDKKVEKKEVENTDEKVVGFLRAGVITSRGVLKTGDIFRFEGQDEVIQAINFKDKTVFFVSGKKFTK